MFMSLTLLEGMRRHTPEKFIDRLLYPASLRGKLPAITALGKGWEKLGFGKGDLHTIVFVDEENPNRKCYFQITRTQRDAKRPAYMGEWSAPRAQLFRYVRFYLHEKDWEEAVKSTGVTTSAHVSNEGNATSKSHNLLIPLDAIKDWSPEIDPRYPGSASVRISKEAFDKIHSLQNSMSDLSLYKSALETVSRLSTLEHFASKLATTTRMKQQLFHPDGRLKQDPIEVFLRLAKKSHPLFRDIPLAAEYGSEEEFAEFVSQHYGFGGRAIRMHAKNIYHIVRTKGGKESAIALAKRLRV